MAENRLDPEGKLYDPAGYEAARTTYLVSGVFVSGLFIILFVIVITSDFDTKTFLWCFFSWFVLSAFTAPFVMASEKTHQENVARKKYELAKEVSELSATSASETSKISNKMEDLESMVSALQKSSIQTGDIIIRGEGNTVIIGSEAVEIINGLKHSDPEVGNALSAILGHLHNIESKEAAKYFEKFVDEINKTESDKTVMKALWNATVSAAPTIKHLVDASTKIIDLFI